MEEVQKEFPKKKLKNPIKFLISLNDEQKHAKAAILTGTITVLRGSAGSEIGRAHV